jgi:hypothetical protein
MLHHEAAPIEQTPIEKIHPIEIEVVRDTLLDPKLDSRRTAKGIHNATRLPQEDIVSILDNTDVARRTNLTSSPEGNPIYVAAEKRKCIAERIADLRCVVGKVIPL